MAPIDSQQDTQLSIFQPDFEHMSPSDALRYIERTKRQLDRFESLPHGGTATLDPNELAAIRRLCDELEISLLKKI